MLKGKELLLEIINNALLAYQSGSNEQQIAFNNTELKAFLSTYKNPPEDIINLSDEMLKNITEFIDPIEEQKKFSATIKYLRGIAELNKNKEEKMLFNEQQKIKLIALEELIKNVIQHNEYLIEHSKTRSEKEINKYRKILSKIQNEEIFTAKDYDVVENIIHNETPNDAESNLDLIYTYMNEFNARKLQNKKEEQKEIKEVSKNDRTVIIKEIVNSLGINYDTLNMQVKLKFLGIKDLESFSNLAKFLKEEIVNKIDSPNITGLIYLLTNSNKNLIDEVITEFEKSSIEFKKLLNTGTNIFSEKGLKNFKNNKEIFVKYQVSLKKLIRNNITILTTDPDYLKNIIRLLEEKNINVTTIFERIPFLLEPKGQNLIEKNLKILDMYGFDVNTFFGENPIYTILGSWNLASKLDFFIEVGLNEQIHKSNDPGLELKNLITKRIYYAYKNNYGVWTNGSQYLSKQDESLPFEITRVSVPKILKVENEEYDQIILKNDFLITEEIIEQIKKDYPIMHLIDEAYRAAIYTEAPVGILKRKTEYVFGTQIISRLKVFKVFKILIDLNLDEKEALFFAITYNTILEPHEYDFINDAVSKIEIGDNYDQLLKTA